MFSGERNGWFIPRPEVQIQHILDKRFEIQFPKLVTVGDITAYSIGDPTADAIVVFPGIGLRLEDEVHDNVFNPFSRSLWEETWGYTGRQQTILLHPPRNTPLSPLTPERFTDSVYRLLEHVFSEKERVPLEKLTIFAFSQGGYIAADMMERYGHTSSLLAHVNELILCSPAGITEAGLAKLGEVINGTSKTSLSGARKIGDHWYARTYFEQLGDIQFFRALQSAAESGIRITLLPEQPGPNALLSEEEYGLLLRLVKEHETVSLVYPQPNDRHIPGHVEAGIKILQAFHVPPEAVDEPPFSWDLARITGETKVLQLRMNLVEPARTHLIDWEAFFRSRPDYKRVDNPDGSYMYLPK